MQAREIYKKTFLMSHPRVNWHQNGLYKLVLSISDRPTSIGQLTAQMTVAHCAKSPIHMHEHTALDANSVQQ